MEKVLGLGGLFFRAHDPQTLGKWYLAVLGIGIPPGDMDTAPWQQQAGPTVFAPFAADTDYFGDPARQFMLNFRVADLEAMIAQITAAGTEVAAIETYPYGRFARLKDPEGNPIELWEPVA